MKNSFIPAVVILLLAAYFVPWQSVKWGKIELLPASTITVSGVAQGQQANQVASFNASVTAVNADKQAASDEVNTKMDELTQSLKDFGIPTEDIKTESLNLSREEVYSPQTGKSSPGDWRANNSISIKLKEVTKVSALNQLLTESGATNVYGPNYTVKDTTGTQTGLMEEALKNAREKAEAIAKGSGKEVGEVINVIEGGTSSPIMPLMRADGLGGGGAPVEPGTTTISQSLTVTFELK